MSFIHVSGPATTEGFPKMASTLIANASVLGFRPSGHVSQAKIETLRIAGISIRNVASGDSDYARSAVLAAIIPGEEDVFEATVSGTAAQSNVGKQYDITATAAGTAQAVNLSGTTYKVVTVVGFINSTTLLVKFNGNYVYANKAN